MKPKLIILSLILISTLFLSAKDVILNKYGHIEITNSNDDLKVNYFMEDNEYYINYHNFTFIGNSFWETINGFLTLTTIEENVPTTLRFYDNEGNLKCCEQYPRIINLKISENKQYSAFFNDTKLIVINSETYQSKNYDCNSTIFDIDNEGNPVYTKISNIILYKDIEYKLPENIRKIIFHNNKPYIFTTKKIFLINDNLEKIIDLNDNFFDAKIYNNDLYVSTKQRSSQNKKIILYKSENYKDLLKIDEVNLEIKKSRTHESINSPLNYYEENSPLPIGNSYGEIQQYGGSPYLHPGVDFLGSAYQDVYAVHDGFVKAVLTTGGDPYWRIAIANENISSETQGYLYAHLNNSSISVTVGDFVSAGEIIGTLYPWSISEFTHIHFSRLRDTGNTWNGTWWTVENPLIDVVNYTDTIPPTFENAIDEDLFAFRDSLGNYQDHFDLIGRFDIICKCHDIANSDWKIDVWNLRYSLHPYENPDSTIFEKFSYSFDMDLDTYFSGNIDTMILNTIYSRDATCYSIGDYNIRDYYHIITNSDGDSLITENDADEIFDSTEFPDGFYYFKVTIQDASLNTSVDSMLVYFDNQIVEVEESFPEFELKLSNYPNPFNPETTISFETTNLHELAKVEIHNMKGQHIREFKIENLKFKINEVVWDGKDNENKPVSSGIYFYKLKSGKYSITRRMLLFK